MSTTEMKNEDVLNNVYIGCDEDGDIHLFKRWPTFNTRGDGSIDVEG